MNLNVMDTGAILEKALQGEKLFPEEAIYLATEGDLLSLGMAAGQIASRLNPAGKAGYAAAKTILYSNVCQPDCPFCHGTVTLDHPEAFTRTAAEVVAEAAEAVAAGATQLFLQGGHRIDLPWSYYTGLVAALHQRFSDVQIFAYSPSELMVFNVLYQKNSATVIGELKDAGMSGLFAAGAESLTTREPEHRALLRGPWNEWFDLVHRCVDAAIPVVAPFAFGLGESMKARVGHLYRVRAVQERTARAGHPAFAALVVYTPASAEAAGVTGHEYLRMLALARILVPSILHVQSSFVTQGAKVAQVALDGGADDLGPTYSEFQQAELAAGRVGAMTLAEMERLIQEAGRTPHLRARW